ncbi:MAG: hypothetical protein LBK97_03735 [Prevotellaceae bacterium]|jgi:hypothetical protein|nr:hypothetical protein [Prevotellaceae bacterium]
MKIIFFTCCFLTFLSSAVAQEEGPGKIITTKDGQKIKTVTLPRGAQPPIIQYMISSGYKAFKVRLHDSIHRSSFDVKFYVEEYCKDSVITHEPIFLEAARSLFVSEILPGITPDGALFLHIRTPEFGIARYFQPKDSGRFKWQIFTATPLGKEVPVLLMYEEQSDGNRTDEKITGLFESVSFKKLRDKKAIVKKIQAETASFYLLFYDVITKS